MKEVDADELHGSSPDQGNRENSNTLKVYPMLGVAAVVSSTSFFHPPPTFFLYTAMRPVSNPSLGAMGEAPADAVSTPTWETSIR
jgi:hypothetical protein